MNEERFNELIKDKAWIKVEYLIRLPFGGTITLGHTILFNEESNSLEKDIQLLDKVAKEFCDTLGCELVQKIVYGAYEKDGKISRIRSVEEFEELEKLSLFY